MCLSKHVTEAQHLQGLHPHTHLLAEAGSSGPTECYGPLHEQQAAPHETHVAMAHIACHAQKEVPHVAVTLQRQRPPCQDTATVLPIFIQCDQMLCEAASTQHAPAAPLAPAGAVSMGDRSCRPMGS